MRDTFMANSANVEHDWYVVDAAGMTPGRLASAVAQVLRGKHKAIYTPNVDCGDHVIIVNADKVVFTGNKLEDKKYYRHSGHPGGIKDESAGHLLARRPERVMELAVKGMLPKNKLGRQMYRKLFVYAGSEHPHEAQKPKTLSQDVKTWFVK